MPVVVEEVDEVKRGPVVSSQEHFSRCVILLFGFGHGIGVPQFIGISGFHVRRICLNFEGGVFVILSLSLNDSKLNSPYLQSIQIGTVRSFSQTPGELWQSAIIKEPVGGAIRVSSLGLDGDQQFDRANHGGVDKAILAYSTDHYAAWENEYANLDQAPTFYGSFGENLSISSQTEVDVCIGDVWEFGDCQLQVSQPRQPCYKLSRRWGIADLSARVQTTGRTGWYFRVLTTGSISAGCTPKLVDRPSADWTISQANQVMYACKDPQRDLELSNCDGLSQAWKQMLSSRAAKRNQNIR